MNYLKNLELLILKHHGNFSFNIKLWHTKNLEKNTLDLYILSKLKATVEKIDLAMKSYDTVAACEEFNQFFEALNNWYIRRNRQRFWKSIEAGKIDQDKQDAYDTLYTALVTMCEASAPLLPFTTEFVWKGLQTH